MDDSTILIEFGERLRGLGDPQQRSLRFCRDLARLSDEELASFLDYLYLQALKKDVQALFLLDALVDFDVFKNALGPRLCRLYACADEAELWLAAEWLSPTHHAPRHEAARRVHHELSSLTLGERRALARHANGTLIEKLMVDPDPVVIRNLLDHPRLREPDVVRIAAKRPNSPEVLRVIFAHPRWLDRYNVKLALLNNPRTPPRLVLHLLPHLTSQDWHELRRSRRFSPGFMDTIDALQQG